MLLGKFPDFRHLRRCKFLAAFAFVVLVFYAENAESACDCGVDCPCDKANCTAGSFWQTSTCVQCPSGYFCEGNSSAPMPCSAGTANINTGSQSSAACVACGSGFNSTAGATSCTPCPAGYNCTTGQASLCSAGWYSLYGEGVCKACPPDKVCADPTQHPQQCASGSEPDVSQISCNSCPSGKYSLNGTSCQPCSSGYYSSGGASKCTICPSGHK
ncbi:multiple epidermal growth factor-like domains protein 6 [Actinia tenebrosa]|uniref:Multiple epidermal growth factor-like domains protein 6 n=1 Tax=Actinia tenebrosa TaxID=6105 RepID=A0A6P8I311_ACTTE|nr:multiple epidermal growth factor-like domains protein 6 [Actinia tenebrosa]